MRIPEYNNQTLYPHRKHPHHQLDDSTNASLPIFLTICTKNRSPVLAHALAHEILRDLWSDKSRWIVGPYVLMPEHSHLIAIEAAGNRTPLSMWIGWWKQQASIRVGGGALLWQRDFWDTTIHTESMLAEKIAYIKNNPISRGLAQTEREWPFQGEIYRIGL